MICPHIKNLNIKKYKGTFPDLLKVLKEENFGVDEKEVNTGTKIEYINFKAKTYSIEHGTIIGCYPKINGCIERHYNIRLYCGGRVNAVPASNLKKRDYGFIYLKK